MELSKIEISQLSKMKQMDQNESSKGTKMNLNR